MKFKIGDRVKTSKKGEYEVVGIGEHGSRGTEMYVLMNEKKNQVFVWGIPFGEEDIGKKAVLIRSAVNYESLLEIEE